MMMNKIDMVKTAFSFDDFDRSSQYLADNFQGTDSVGGPAFDKAGWVGMGKMFKHSLPDIKVVIDEIHEEGDKVMVKSHFTGTFTNDFDLTALGMGIVPASGKIVTFPSSAAEISFNGDKITRFHNMDTGPEAGIPGMMKTLSG